MLNHRVQKVSKGKDLEELRKKERMTDVGMFRVHDNVIHDLQTKQLTAPTKNPLKFDHEIIEKTLNLVRQLFKILFGMNRAPQEDKGELSYIETQLQTQQRLLDKQVERINTLEAQYLNMIKFATRTKEDISTCTLGHAYFVQ